jgi:hypothetical protein
MAVKIPLRALPAYTQDVSLEGSAYKFRVKLNYRGQYYTLDILTKEGVDIVTGMKLALNAQLLRAHPGLGLPPGELFVLDVSGSNDVIAGDDIQDRIELTYLTEAELAAI